jgi:hypothetical protein
MLSWAEFRGLRPDLTDAGRELLCQWDIGLGFLSTVRPDGGPRLHPICPILTDTGMYAFIIPSPKLQDLLRDGRYALHSYPRPDDEDAFYLTGMARLIDSPEVRQAVIESFLSQSGRTGPIPDFADQTLVELLIDTCLLTRTTGHGDPDAKHAVWKAPSL